MRLPVVLATSLFVLGCSSASSTPTPAAATATIGPPATTSVTAAPSPGETVAKATPTISATATTLITPSPTALISASPSAIATESALPSESALPTESALPSGSPSATPAGPVIQVIAGGGTQPPTEGGTALETALQRPTGVAVGSIGDVLGQQNGDVWIVDGNLGQGMRVLADGTIRDVFGELLGPQGITTAPARGPSVPYVADTADYRVATPNGHGGVTVLAGDATNAGFHGDGGPAKRALLAQPYDVSANYVGIYVADTSNQRIRLIGFATNTINTVAGNGTAGLAGDGGPATDAEISDPQGIAVDASNTELFIADTINHRIRRVDIATGTITTVVGYGDGTAISYAPGLTGLQTPLIRPNSLALDPQGNLYFPVFWGDRGTMIMRMDASGGTTQVAGGGTTSTAGVPATDFAFPDILGMTINPFNGDLLVCGSDGKVYDIPGVAPPAT